MLIAQMGIHIVARQDDNCSGFSAEFHRVEYYQAVQVREPIEQGKPDGAAIKAKNALVEIVFGEALKRMDASPIVSQ